MSVHDSLVQLYRDAIPPFLADPALSGKLAGHDGPFLMDCWEERQFTGAPVRLLVVGQQTNRYEAIADIGQRPDPVRHAMKCYVGERLGIGHRNLPFFHFAHQLDRDLNGGDRPFGFLWANLWKYERRYNQPPAPELREALLERLNILPREIAACSPSAAVFFTGHGNDGALRHMFAGIEFIAIPGHDIAGLARLSHRDLPARAFRTHHPGYLRRSGQESLVREKLAALIEGRSR